MPYATLARTAKMTAVVNRLLDAGAFDIFLMRSRLKEDFRFGREHDGHPTAPWSWDDLD